MRKPRIEFLKSCPGLEGLPADGLPEVAFAGRSNVGKSSLINSLTAGPSVARTSSRPGCTQMLNVYRNIGKSFYLVDLPGYGYAKAPRKTRGQWIEWLWEYLGFRQPLRGTVLLVDCRHTELRSDEQMVDFLISRGKPYLIALTKSDKLGSAALSASVRSSSRLGPVVPVSARTGRGLDEMWKWLRNVVAG